MSPHKTVVSISRNQFSKRDVEVKPIGIEELAEIIDAGRIVDRLDGGVF